MAFEMTVKCQYRDFYAYWYGVGEIVAFSEEGALPPGKPLYTFVVNYGDDRYLANYQADRFSSGLIFSKVEEV